jgi:hypothetical protein
MASLRQSTTSRALSPSSSRKNSQSLYNSSVLARVNSKLYNAGLISKNLSFLVDRWKTMNETIRINKEKINTETNTKAKEALEKLIIIATHARDRAEKEIEPYRDAGQHPSVEFDEELLSKKYGGKKGRKTRKQKKSKRKTRRYKRKTNRK